MMKQFILLKYSDPSTGDRIEGYLPLPVTIGRSEKCDMTLHSEAVSRKHALIAMTDNGLVVRDLNSANGIYVNGTRTKVESIGERDLIAVGPFNIYVARVADESRLDVPIFLKADFLPLPDITTTQIDVNELRRLQNVIEESQQTGLYSPLVQDPATTTNLGIDKLKTEQLIALSVNDVSEVQKGFINIDKSDACTINPNHPAPIFNNPIVNIAELRQYRLPVEETRFLTIGGGIGSFTWVDHLVIHGANPEDIVSIGFENKPYGRYRRLCENSQIPDHERLRSDSGSTPDNIWGFPGYALREIAANALRGRMTKAGTVVWKIFGEPVLAETFTPISGRVFDSIDREAERIGWYKMARPGRVRQIRKTDDGRYAVLYNDEKGHDAIMLAEYIHLAVGYSGIRMLPDLTHYRLETGDFAHVVNSYEPHAHVYEDLGEHGGTVLIRGRGIVASRLIQRIHEVREATGADIRIVHLMRSPVPHGHQYKGKRRRVRNHWEMQPFNWPKAALIGKLQIRFQNASDSTRENLLNDWGGTTTADRRDWEAIIQKGMREGWYEIQFGPVSQVKPHRDGRIMTEVCGKEKELQAQIISDYVIDATGLNGRLEDNPLLCDILNTYTIERNVKGRLDVTETFEVKGMRNGAGRFFAVGAMTFGSHYPGVDSFLGLQYAAQQTVNNLVSHRAVKRLGPLKSVNQWVRWAGGIRP